MSSHLIPFTISQVANVSVAAINASRTNSTGAGGGNFYFGGVMPSQSGEPNKVYSINSDNYKDVLGEALHPSKGSAAMSMRYLREAVDVGAGYVVPIVGDGAQRPVIGVKAPAAEGEPHVAVARVVAFETDVTTDADELLAIYPADGDVSQRSVSITPIADKAGFFDLTLTKTLASGSVRTQLQREVSFDPTAKDDSGNHAYIVDVLESSGLINITLAVDFDAESFTSLSSVQFSGGTRGDFNAIDPASYEKAVSALRNFVGEYHAVLPLGLVDPVVIKLLHGIVRDRRIDGFFDVPPTLNYADAIEWMNTSGFDSNASCFYHFPYKASDLFYAGAKAVWGISSIAYGAKLKGVQSVSPVVGGYHFSPAGSERGVITRSGVEALPNLGEPDYEAMVTARINKVSTDDGTLVIDDALTATKANNYLRFQHVTSIINSISRRFYKSAMKLKHQPDGITLEALDDLMRAIGEDYTAVGALVTPRDEADGEAPFQWSIEQKDIDLIEVIFYACPTGTSRRIAGVPIVLK